MPQTIDDCRPGTVPLLIFGCGYVGLRVAQAWQGYGRPVYALTRSRAAVLAAQGIVPLVGDVLQAESLPPLPPDVAVLYAIGYDRTHPASMHAVYVDGLAHVLDRLASPCRFVYVSSTSVYGQTDGSWVDEDSPTEPLEESGRIVRAAEQLLQQRLPQAVIVRSGGIYGPQRLLRRRQQLLAGEPLTGDPERWLNLVHVDDLVAALLLVLDQSPPGQIYNAVDDQPVSRRQFYTLLAQLYGGPAPHFATSSAESLAPHRRVANRRLKQLGWRPRYPTIYTGLPAAVAASETPP
ncbi:MAG: NAD-dependent epimerase/dehydratase family protein [Gemmataceae bacterium]|nr:NAD-dependent epimerase/dehydratase family protein [Gemmataceae bacterium]